MGGTTQGNVRQKAGTRGKDPIKLPTNDPNNPNHVSLSLSLALSLLFHVVALGIYNDDYMELQGIAWVKLVFVLASTSKFLYVSRHLYLQTIPQTLGPEPCHKAPFVHGGADNEGDLSARRAGSTEAVQWPNAS